MKLWQKTIGVIIFFSYLAIPVFIWIKLSFTPVSFVNFANSSRSLGQILGLLGVSLFTLNFILAARLRMIEDWIGGLNRVYILHHQIGAYALIFLLFHPLFLTLQYLVISVVAAAQFLLPPTAEIAVWLGIGALITLTILLIITFFFRIEYQRWKITHRLLGVSLLLAFLHVLTISGDLSSNLIQRLYLLTVMGIGLLAWFYRSLLHKWLVKRTPYRVKNVEHINEDILEIELSPTGKPITFDPGQFVFVRTRVKGISAEEHPFSITSAHGTNGLSFAAKSLGDYTKTLKLLKPDAEIYVEGPYGRFLFKRIGNVKQIWIAGGIGITPFLSMARSLSPNNSYTIVFFYTVSTMREAVFREEMATLTRQVPSFKFVIHLSQEKGRLTAETVTREVPEVKSYDIFLCGPPPMMSGMRQKFRKLGIKNYRIHSEEFALYD